MLEAMQDIMRWAAMELQLESLGDVGNVLEHEEVPADIAAEWAKIKSVPVNVLAGSRPAGNIGVLIDRCLRRLTSKQRKIVLARSHVRYPQTQRELARRFQCTTQAVSDKEH